MTPEEIARMRHDCSLWLAKYRAQPTLNDDEIIDQNICDWVMMSARKKLAE